LLDPLGMLEPQVIVNLLQQVGVRVDLSSHGVGLLKDSSVPRDSSSKASPE
jgi:hypothetical protein